MESIKLYAVLATVAALGLVACGKTNTAAPPQADASTTAASEPPAPRSACDLLTAAEMSTALGGAVTQEASSRRDTCTYSPTQSSGPFAELKFTTGDGQAAMMASGFANRHAQLGRLPRSHFATIAAPPTPAVDGRPAIVISS